MRLFGILPHLVAVSVLLGSQKSDEELVPLEELLGTRNYAEYQTKPKYHDRLKILRRAIEQRERILPRQLENYQLGVVHRTLEELRSLARYSYELSVQETNNKELQHREVKRLEIRLRRLAEELRDWELSVPFEDRAPFERARESCERLRDRLLRQLFGSALGRPEPPPPGNFFVPPSSGSSSLPAAQSLLDIDKFTEEEFRKVQYTRKLSKRVDVFLDIAESRIAEIERRRDAREWEDEDEPNPLEFYTYDELLYAYNRALDSAMDNIDEQAAGQREPEGEVKEALEKLGKRLPVLARRLEALKPLIREQRDEALVETYEEALRLTDIALKGVQLGLGALPED